uniref:CSON007647 protein n=1 Tax=Culicoides sonorensis TaxID=179676 RepID=A0A336KC60_CULSO
MLRQQNWFGVEQAALLRLEDVKKELPLMKMLTVEKVKYQTDEDAQQTVIQSKELQDILKAIVSKDEIKTLPNVEEELD